jgi:2-phosphosulfolactate phosphatase
LFAGSLVLGRATAQVLLALQPAEVCFVITGEWVDRDGDEDIACADYIEALLHGEDPDPELYAARVRNSDFGRRFQADSNANLPPAISPSARSADRFDFALLASHSDGHLQLNRSRAGQESPLRSGREGAKGQLRNGLRLQEK